MGRARHRACRAADAYAGGRSCRRQGVGSCRQGANSATIRSLRLRLGGDRTFANRRCRAACDGLRPGNIQTMKDLLYALWRYRHFILSAIWNDLRTRFTRSRLGAIWLILQPLAQSAIYALILSRVLAA